MLQDLNNNLIIFVGDFIGHNPSLLKQKCSSSLTFEDIFQLRAEMGKNERDRRSFPFSSVQFMNLAHIFADFKFMIVSDCGSYF